MKKFLVIDDDKCCRETLPLIIASYLGNMFEFLNAKDGVEGLAIVNKHNPEIIITDFSMPLMNGLMFLECLMKEKIKPDLLIFSSGDLATKEINQATILGAHHCLHKPVLAQHILPLLKGHY